VAVLVSGATVVAWYGDKPPGLAGLIGRLQRACGAGFAARPVAEVHATIIGLGGAAAGHRDVDGVRRHLAAGFAEPMEIQFGGFARADRRLLSWGQTLHERSLGLRGNHLVLIGWPVTPEPSSRLAEIRRGCERFGFRHKYHRGPEDLDPDAYLVLGELAPPASEGLVERLRDEHLATAVRLPLTVGDLSLVEYTDARLPAATSAARPIGPR
jgi:hypothetical protein